jgi:hypothetical protein
MRTPQAQIEHASPSTVTVDNGSFFNGSDTEVLEITNEDASSEFETENTTSLEETSEEQLEEQLNESETEISPENQQPLETTIGDDDLISDLESRSTNLPTEEQLSSDELPTEAPRRGQRVPNDLDELRALQENPPEAEQAAALNTDRLSGITESLGELTPSQIGRSAPQFNSATQAALENEITTVESDLPVLDQPTGLEPGESPLQQATPIPLERTAEIEQNSDQGTIQTVIEPTPEPEPAQVASPILRPSNEQELERAMDGLEIDTQVNTSLGDPPDMDLTGQADPNQAEREQQRNNTILRDTELEEINGFRRDFGENEVYPSIPTEELSSSEELTAASTIPILESEHTFPILLESDEALLNEDLLTEFDTERTQAINESQIASEEFDANRAIELENGLETIRNEETLATEEQIGVREENADAISGYRDEHEQESDEIISEYEAEVDEQREEHDSDFEEEFDSTMDSAESFFDEAEGEVSERERQAAERVARRRREAEEAENERTWLDDAVDAVRDFFNDLIDAVTQIIDDLRAAVKDLFDAVKARVVALIDAARNVLVGMIRAFGNMLIQISNIALSRFPGLRDRINGLINDSMDWAEERVNEIAENLKIAVVAALDFIANAIDSLLATFQTIIVGVLEFFREFTIAILEMAYAFYEELLNIILQIKTILALVAVMTAANLFLSVAWHFIGQQMKERLINLYVETLIDIFESAPDDFNHGFLWPLYVNMQLGTLYEMQGWDMETKLAYFDKLAGMIISGEFWLNFILGIFRGMWDNIYGIVEGIWMLVRFIFYDLWVLIGTVVEKLREIIPEIVDLIEEFNIDIHRFIEELKTTGKEKLDEIRSNFTQENIESFFEGLGDDLRTRAQVLGGRLAEQARDFMLRDDAYATIGMALGRVTGYLLVEILLAVFTGGIGTAIKWGLKGVKVVVRIVRMLGSVGRAGGFISKIIRFFSKGVKWLMRAIVKFAEKIAKVAKNLFDRFKTIFSNLSRRIDDIVARLTGSTPRPRPRPRPDGPDSRPRRPRDRDRDNDGPAWIAFIASTRVAFNGYQRNGITRSDANRVMRGHIGRNRRVARVPSRGMVNLEKGWFEISAIKRGATINRKRKIVEVPIIKRERWRLAKIAIQSRLSRIRDNQINRAGLTSILRPYIRDYKFSRLLPEWDEHESDWNIMGAMSPLIELAEVNDHNARYNTYKRAVINAIITANFPGKQEGFSQTELEQIARRDTILDAEARKAIRNVDVIVVDNRTRLNIKVTMKHVNPLVRYVHKVKRLPEGTPRSPIKMDWWDADYGQIYLRVRNPNSTRFWDQANNPPPLNPFTVNPTIGATLVVPRSQSNYRLTSPDVRGRLTTRIGIHPINNVIRSMRLRRTRSSSVRGPAARSFRTILHHYGHNWEARNHQADHVKDLGFGGHDNFRNLWPLGARQNAATAREIYRQRIYYQVNGVRRQSTPGQGHNIGRWFIVNRVRRIT